MTSPSEETKIAVLETKVDNLGVKVDNMDKKLDALTEKVDDRYVNKEDFQKLYDDHLYWRNVLVAGILLNIALGVVLKVLNT
jgi:hypothetical protein